ncbi:uncharacterized protein TRIADDRAFT_24388 [Trichoplax adhaerens]|uniref:COP9 signalosome complex subunit 6 n=1 Tax=Trichoplax adhaerens TaxID=10228 RepID=B3RUB6_TRIAD|nr:hypothetical protein TRIADDRAFT_24388 [Trichoplax adhaerens]EDV25783.1 hypothetical protein TRIADDRAFT_24388 [Trichoplax adhaerens]|eukprot:XP_002111816.1 hypothetical protein TRIADDRAFT_24388 [Trichoplax adhaerens]
MQIDDSGEEPSSKIMAPSSVSPSISVLLHPLVVMNISDHFMRFLAQESSEDSQIIGALIGTQKGRTVEISNSYELDCNFNTGKPFLNVDYFKDREEKFRELTDEFMFIGWYTIGSSPNETDLNIHQQFCQIYDSPLLLKLNPNCNYATNLPVAIFETVVDAVDNQAKILFLEIPYTLATEDSERIGVDHIAKTSYSETTSTSSAADNLLAQYNAIKMLHTRVKLLTDYVKAVRAGKLSYKHEILRDISSMCQRLPIAKSKQFTVESVNQYNDVLLMACLAAITQGCKNSDEFITKANDLYEASGHRMRTFFY